MILPGNFFITEIDNWPILHNGRKLENTYHDSSTAKECPKPHDSTRKLSPT